MSTLETRNDAGIAAVVTRAQIGNPPILLRVPLHQRIY